LTLVAATAELVEADLEGRQALAQLLSAEVPEDWPPELYERRFMQMAAEQLREPAAHGWSLWYLLATRLSPPAVVGICSFEGPPDTRGSVEISFSVLSPFRIQGYATEAVSRLVAWAFSHQSVVEVSAETMPHLRRSIRVMEKSGFEFIGPGSEPGVVRYAVRKRRLG
jgi:ribosomal-protein-alanine N-acetyltransferase